ncbi:MAG: hypothetical protein JWM78_2298 [Verrucomicrobiaceae bacterium]|nr:hypothetical protein [Verrucomicrobiaceae bacterium]
MKSTEAVSGIIEYLNQRDLKNADAAAHHDRPLYIGNQGIYANYAGFSLGSLFQPIVTLNDESIPIAVAYEALLAAHTSKGSLGLGSALSPEAIFSLQNGNTEITTLDRLARTLHTLNFLLQDFTGALHLNVHPNHLLAVSADHGQVFERILRQCGLDPSSIVLEIPEYSIREKNRLRDAMRHWQSRGYKIAIDQLGYGHTQFERVLELKPDAIKIARPLVQDAVAKQREHDTLFKLIEKSKKHGVSIIASGIETLEQQSLLIELGVTQLQGYLYGLPTPQCAAPLDVNDIRAEAVGA